MSKLVEVRPNAGSGSCLGRGVGVRTTLATCILGRMASAVAP